MSTKTTTAPRLRLVAGADAGPTTESLVTPALYPTVIRHTRSNPWRHAFRYRHPMWLIDLDHLPAGRLLGGVLRFEARDHLGLPPDRSARTSLRGQRNRARTSATTAS